MQTDEVSAAEVVCDGCAVTSSDDVGCGFPVGVALGVCWGAELAAGAADGWFPRPLNSTSSALDDEASESAGEGLRMAMCAMAVVLSGVEEGEDGAMDSELESDDT